MKIHIDIDVWWKLSEWNLVLVVLNKIIIRFGSPILTTINHNSIHPLSSLFLSHLGEESLAQQFECVTSETWESSIQHQTEMK